ncbi:hypothetical protein [Tenacibaculum aiptasiae]|uniref:hypothetical protein n=1 Tax=Tenacibaculum aiptasiae TaxID=426481 RepID=UPI00232C87B2|nr:hypothetical protein [Tenacibaculum aiptasiae]
MKRNLYILALLFVLTNCQRISTKEESYNQVIYDIMDVVIKDQKLKLNYGLNIEPEQNFGNEHTDQENFELLLAELASKKNNQKTDAINWRLQLNSQTLLADLTREDISEMIEQKEKLKGFTWDNSKLGFDLSNKKDWYSFSIPLFSKDRKSAVMMIRNLCSGLCGEGKTIFLTKKEGKWTSEVGMIWMH